MRPPRTSSMMSEIFPTCSPSDDITLSPSSVAAAMMSGPGPSPMPPPTMLAPPRVLPCGLIEPMIHLLKKWCSFNVQAAYPSYQRHRMSSLPQLTERLDISQRSTAGYKEVAHRYLLFSKRVQKLD